MVSHGCVVSGGVVRSSILSPGVRINSYSEVAQSILMHGVNVGRHSKVRKAIIDKGVQIPERTIIGYDLEEDAKRYVVSPGGVVVVPKEEKIIE
jgi:glucose-1-phosphate adenylyltransferase